MDAVADAVAVDLKRSEAGEGAQVLAADLRRRKTHPIKKLKQNCHQLRFAW